MPDPSWIEVARQVAALPDADFLALVERAGPLERLDLLRARFRFDRASFSRWCWPERFDLPFNALHHELFGPERLGYRDRKDTELEAVAAPRGYAKSTIKAFARVVHDIVYDLEAYIVLVSSEMRLATSFSKDIKAAMEDRAGPLAQLYGPFDVSGGAEEWLVSVRGRPTVGVLARGARTAIRGAKHPTRGLRPTKVVLDDVEDRIRVLNPKQREQAWAWLHEDVLKLGKRGGGLVVDFVGTVLHSDAVLARLLGRPGWRTRRWQAIISWPERQDLWERCREVWGDLTLGPYREAAARAFYEAHRADMDRGVQVLDPDVEDIYALHTQLWSEGLGSFLKEKQNDPVDPETQIFSSSTFRRFRIVDDPATGPTVVTDTGRRVPVADLTLWGRWDPCAGDPTGDYAAIAIVGRDRWGYCYVLDVWMRRAKPSEQLAAAWVLAERWSPDRPFRMSLESNGFQDLVAEPLGRERRERQEQGRYHRLIVVEQPSTEDKVMRISSMEPEITNGWMQFSDRVAAEVLHQFDQFPTGGNDDGPDAVHGAWRASGGSPPSMGTRRVVA